MTELMGSDLFLNTLPCHRVSFLGFPSKDALGIVDELGTDYWICPYCMRVPHKTVWVKAHKCWRFKCHRWDDFLDDLKLRLLLDVSGVRRIFDNSREYGRRDHKKENQLCEKFIRRVKKFKAGTSSSRRHESGYADFHSSCSMNMYQASNPTAQSTTSTQFGFSGSSARNPLKGTGAGQTADGLSARPNTSPRFTSTFGICLPFSFVKML